MLLALDPSQTWDFEIPGQEDQPPEERVVLVCRYLNVRQMFRLRQARQAALKTVGTDEPYISMLLEALAMVVVGFKNHPDTNSDGIDRILDLATASQLWEWSGELVLRQTLAEQQRKNSESRQPGSQAPSAVNAGQGSACVETPPS